MIVTYAVVAVLCFLGSARGGALPPDPEPCPPDDEGCALPTTSSEECTQGACAGKIGLCLSDNTHTLLAHPNHCNLYCRCDHSGGDICEMPCPTGTRFNPYSQVCDLSTCPPTTPVNYCFPFPCEDDEYCINVPSKWWGPFIGYTCKNPCDPNPCLEGGVCVSIDGGRDYRCDGCPAACYGKNCDCQRPDPCDDPNNCVHGTCTSPNRWPSGLAKCGTFTCTCAAEWGGTCCNYSVACPSWVCEGKENYNMPHPHICNRYCACGYGGTINSMPCPAGLYFNITACACTDFTCLQNSNLIQQAYGQRYVVAV